jgi:hypothetical protein
MYVAFQPFDFERTWLSVFLKRVVRTKFDIYIFIIINTNILFFSSYQDRKNRLRSPNVIQCFILLLAQPNIILSKRNFEYVINVKENERDNQE